MFPLRHSSAIPRDLRGLLLSRLEKPELRWFASCPRVGDKRTPLRHPANPAVWARPAARYKVKTRECLKQKYDKYAISLKTWHILVHVGHLRCPPRVPRDSASRLIRRSGQCH